MVVRLAAALQCTIGELFADTAPEPARAGRPRRSPSAP
jgi:hypothetical protein